MARTKEFDDLAVVRAARDVFWERGYVATSLAQLQAATGLSKSSFYESYDSKRGLFERAAQNYLDEIIGPRLAPLEADGAGTGELIGYFEGLRDFLRTAPKRSARRGCLLLNTAMELNDLDEPAEELVIGYRARVRNALLKAVKGALGSNPAPSDAERRADVLTAGQIGLFLTARLDPALAASSADAMIADIRAW